MLAASWHAYRTIGVLSLSGGRPATFMCMTMLDIQKPGRMGGKVAAAEASPTDAVIASGARSTARRRVLAYTRRIWHSSFLLDINTVRSGVFWQRDNRPDPAAARLLASRAGMRSDWHRCAPRHSREPRSCRLRP